jgi:hypothetical protein
MENENEEKITVYCDSCIDGNSDYGTKAELLAAGWLISDYEQLCPLCNYGE